MRISDWSSDVCSSDLAQSPLIAVTDDQDVIVRTAQVRLKLGAKIETPLARVELPVVAELGSAAARIASIDCAPGAHDAVSLAVTTSPAMVAIGSRSEERRVGKVCRDV